MLTDRDYMDRALFLAARGRGRTSPNPMVGAVVVSRGRRRRRQGYHERAGEPHAEVRALDDGRRAGARRDAVLHARAVLPLGRTGPCVVRIVEAGIVRVVAAVDRSESAASAGAGSRSCAQHGVEVEVGPGREAATALNQPFFTLMREAPAVRRS